MEHNHKVILAEIEKRKVLKEKYDKDFGIFIHETTKSIESLYESYGDGNGNIILPKSNLVINKDDYISIKEYRDSMKPRIKDYIIDMQKRVAGELGLNESLTTF